MDQVGTRSEIVKAIARPPESRRGDIADQASWESETDVPRALAKIAKEEGQQTAEFLARKAERVHDKCKDCGDPIPEARRKAIPNAVRCTTCHGKIYS